MIEINWSSKIILISKKLWNTFMIVWNLKFRNLYISVTEIYKGLYRLFNLDKFLYNWYIHICS